MKKKVSILSFLFLFYLALPAQNFISKLHCLAGYSIEVHSSIPMSDGNTIATGKYTKPSTSPFAYEFFLCKLDSKGELIWFKTFKNPFLGTSPLTIELTLRTMADNKFALYIALPALDKRLFLMDDQANTLWSKTTWIQDISGFLNEKSLFFTDSGELFKMDYSGNIIWSNSFYRNEKDRSITDKITPFDANHLLFAQDLGYDFFANTPQTHLNRINLVLVNSTDGTITSKKIIQGLKNDTMQLKAIKVINDKVLIVGETGLPNNNGNKGFVLCLDKKFNILWAKKINLTASSQNFGIENLEQLANNNYCLLSCYHGDITTSTSSKNRFIMAKMNLATGIIDSALHQGRVLDDDDLFNFPYTFHNFNTLQHIHGLAFSHSFYFTSTTNFFQQNTCNNQSATLLTKDFAIYIKEDDLTELQPTLPLEANTDKLIFGNLSFQTYNQCPECLCPTTDKIKVKICSNQSYTLASGKKVNTTGIYTDTTKTTDGCLRFFEINLTASPFVETKLDFALCQAIPSIKIAKKTYTTPGNYTDTLRTKAGCDSILLISIKDLSTLSVSLGEDKELLESEKLQLAAQTTPPDVIKQYTWFPSGTTACDTCQSIEIAPSDNQWYAVQARQGECTASDTLVVKLLKEKTTYLPNAFSPNGDQNNDLFRPFCADVVRNINTFEVYDRWGNLLYRKSNFMPNSADIGWDGTYQGQKADQGVYTYWVEVQLRSGKLQRYAGDVLLLR